MYIIIEIQTSNAGEVGIVPPASYADKQEAESCYHSRLASAAISAVNIHAVSMLREDGALVKSEVYYHGVDPEA